MSARLEVSHLTMTFGAGLVLDDIGLDVPAGAYCVLLGPSGSGKTTLLSLLGGFVPPTRGRISLEGVDVTALPPARRPTATVFQDYALFPHMSVGANVGFGLAMRGVPRARRRVRVEAALAAVDLAGFAARRPHALSGGQRQRVALARALVVEPQVLLLDEPLGALDVALRRQVQDELKALQRRAGVTSVHVTHDQEEAMALADLLVVLNRGRIEDVGDPARVYGRPRTRFAATFLGDGNLIAGRGDGTTVSTAIGTLPVPAVGDVVILLRPERIGLEGEIVLGEGSVQETAFLGTHWRCRVAVPGLEQPLLVRLPADRPPPARLRLCTERTALVPLPA